MSTQNTASVFLRLHLRSSRPQSTPSCSRRGVSTESKVEQGRALQAMRSTLGAVALAGWLAGPASALIQSNVPSPAPDLYQNQPEAPVGDLVLPWATSRYQSIDFDPRVIRDLPGGQLHIFRVPAFEDEGYEIALSGRESWGTSTVIWQVSVVGRPSSYGSAVFHKDLAIVRIATEGRATSYIEPVFPRNAPIGTPARYVFRERGQNFPADCGAGVSEIEIPVQPIGGSSTALGSAPTTYADIALFYSTTARIAAGSTAAIEARAISIHSAANSAHADSETKLRFRLVHLGELNYNETAGIDVALDWLAESSEAGNIRDEVGADLVHMLVNAQGTASSPSAVGRAFTPGSFGVTKWNAQDYVYAHEVGHNLGCVHEDDTAPPPYARPYEIVETWDLVFSTWTQTQRTIMWSSGSAASIVPRFSNPDKTWVMTGGSCAGFGDPACVDEVRETGNAATADMARFIDEVRSSTADNRQPVMYLDAAATGNGDATKLSPENNLSDVLGVSGNGWLDATEADSDISADIRLADGVYPAPLVIDRKVTLVRVDPGTSGVVLLGQ